jgi:hypothetical protein
MATTGIASFNLDVNDLIEEAFERCGKELRTGYDFRTARRSMNLLTIEWANRGINLWTIEEGSIPLVQGQITYALPDNTIDLLDQITRTGSSLNQQDLNINRISESTYSTIPNKNTTGRPIQVWINRQSGQNNATVAELAATITSTATTITLDDVTMLGSAGFIKLDNEIISYSNLVKSSTSSAGTLSNCGRAQQNTLAAAHTVGAAVTVVNPPSINVWPTPDQGSLAQPYYTFVYWRMRRVQDAGTGVSTQDIPFRFITCMVAGLAYYLSMKLPDVPMDRVVGLKQEYEQQFQLAAEEDREKANVRFVPRSMNYYR